MRRKKRRDNIEECAHRALVNGFGVHYGHYIAWKDGLMRFETPDEARRRQEAQEIAEAERMRQQEKEAADREVLASLVTLPGRRKDRPVRLCAICGKPLPPHYKKYHPGACADKGREIYNKTYRKPQK